MAKLATTLTSANLSASYPFTLEKIIGICTLITNSPGWLTPVGGFFLVAAATPVIDIAINPDFYHFLRKILLPLEKITGRCTLITHSPSRVTPSGGFYLKK
ncbi:hypothetical protein [Nostoc sp.]|uniref:hypothetical protein n=1 Tax=Nostoc sp. TaxID=1180 RepID=UPI002FFD06B2